MIPRWPLLSGVLPFMFSRGVPMRWAVFSFFGALGVALWPWLDPRWHRWQRGDNLAPWAAFSDYRFRHRLHLVAAVASVVITIVTESSEGNNQISHWPTVNITEWFAELVYLLIAGSASAVPGGLIGQFVAPDSPQRALWIAGSVWLCFPVVLLSQLDVSSPFAILSGKVLASLVRCPFSLMLFYIESGLLIAGCVLAAMFNGRLMLFLVIVIPLSMAAVLLYARLLGRLAWKLAESMPAADSADASKK